MKQKSIYKVRWTSVLSFNHGNERDIRTDDGRTVDIILKSEIAERLVRLHNAALKAKE
jgi:hypothetical protein